MFNNFQNTLFTRVNYIITAAYCFVNRLIIKNTGFFFPATGYFGKNALNAVDFSGYQMYNYKYK
jgi:hypothetical protein